MISLPLHLPVLDVEGGERRDSLPVPIHLVEATKIARRYYATEGVSRDTARPVDPEELDPEVHEGYEPFVAVGRGGYLVSSAARALGRTKNTGAEGRDAPPELDVPHERPTPPVEEKDEPDQPLRDGELGGGGERNAEEPEDYRRRRGQESGGCLRHGPGAGGWFWLVGGRRERKRDRGGRKQKDPDAAWARAGGIDHPRGSIATLFLLKEMRDGDVSWAEQRYRRLWRSQKCF